MEPTEGETKPDEKEKPGDKLKARGSKLMRWIESHEILAVGIVAALGVLAYLLLGHSSSSGSLLSSAGLGPGSSGGGGGSSTPSAPPAPTPPAPPKAPGKVIGNFPIALPDLPVKTVSHPVAKTVDAIKSAAKAQTRTVAHHVATTTVKPAAPHPTAQQTRTATLAHLVRSAQVINRNTSLASVVNRTHVTSTGHVTTHKPVIPIQIRRSVPASVRHFTVQHKAPPTSTVRQWPSQLSNFLRYHIGF